MPDYGNFESLLGLGRPEPQPDWLRSANDLMTAFETPERRKARLEAEAARQELIFKLIGARKTLAETESIEAERPGKIRKTLAETLGLEADRPGKIAESKKKGEELIQLFRDEAQKIANSDAFKAADLEGRAALLKPSIMSMVLQGSVFNPETAEEGLEQAKVLLRGLAKIPGLHTEILGGEITSENQDLATSLTLNKDTPESIRKGIMPGSLAGMIADREGKEAGARKKGELTAELGLGKQIAEQKGMEAGARKKGELTAELGLGKEIADQKGMEARAARETLDEAKARLTQELKLKQEYQQEHPTQQPRPTKWEAEEVKKAIAAAGDTKEFQDALKINDPKAARAVLEQIANSQNLTILNDPLDYRTAQRQFLGAGPFTILGAKQIQLGEIQKKAGTKVGGSMGPGKFDYVPGKGFIPRR